MVCRQAEIVSGVLESGREHGNATIGDLGMNRRNLLKTVGAIGVGSMIPIGRVRAGQDTIGNAAIPHGVDCVLVPMVRWLLA